MYEPIMIKGTYEKTPSYGVISEGNGVVLALKACLESAGVHEEYGEILNIGISIRAAKDPHADISVANVGAYAQNLWSGLKFSKVEDDYASVHYLVAVPKDHILNQEDFLAKSAKMGVVLNETLTNKLDASMLVSPVGEIREWFDSQMAEKSAVLWPKEPEGGPEDVDVSNLITGIFGDGAKPVAGNDPDILSDLFKAAKVDEVDLSKPSEKGIPGEVDPDGEGEPS